MFRMVKYFNEYPIKNLTLYGFSTENWGRPEDEVMGLFRLLENFIREKAPEVHKRDIKLRHLGRLDELPRGLQEAITGAVELTRDNARMTLNVAFNYGGRAEIVDAVREIISNGIDSKHIDEKLFASYLYTKGLPDVDLLIRTGDELRLSNFLIWQTAYSEYYFTRVLWPDFGKKEIERALLSYSRRKRRFGAL
jgi:undecaprenyl diphosphate synthase